MKHILSAKHIMLGATGLAVLSALSGCQSNSEENQNAQESQNKFIVAEQLSNGKYVIVEEMPTTGPSHAIIRSKDENGTIHERVMTEAEMKSLADEEYKKMQSGKSELNGEPHSEGMGLGGTILAAAGGALLGNMIGNALMNNKNVQRHQDMSNRSAYHRSASGMNSSPSSTSPKKSFFGGSSSKSTSGGGFFGG
ncbi:MAG: hypothetical protein PHW18_10250 [Sulfuricurvum sp.]|uniref:hypothetical protein n=1 Tax=Sulfuricurvum sp. TaxID=2025608 RepID=UPI00261E95B5|nr:hypothetical protein [Sulfuricurvum sp.]MDD2829943.1 hypothetical protein [Sulfuricurvum sp.]MDD4950098.1 hypothetical protein [Sulfuricurvum sp.]